MFKVCFNSKHNLSTTDVGNEVYESNKLITTIEKTGLREKQYEDNKREIYFIPKENLTELMEKLVEEDINMTNMFLDKWSKANSSIEFKNFLVYLAKQLNSDFAKWKDVGLVLEVSKKEDRVLEFQM